MPALAKGKGKGKAKAVDDEIQSSERSPLLASASGQATHLEHRQPRRPSRLRSLLLTAGLVLFSLLLSAVLFVILLAASFRPSPSELESLPRTAFRYTLPDSVSLLKLDEDGVLLNVSLRCAIDADRALGLAWADGAREPGADWWEALRRWTAHHTLARLPPMIHVSLPDSVAVALGQGSSASVRVMQTLPIEIVPDADQSKDWLRPVTFTVLARPDSTSGEWWDLAKRVWADGHANISVTVPTAIATYQVPYLSRYTTFKRENLAMRLDVPVPSIPGLPSPGRPLDPASLVKLERYSFHTQDTGLFLDALATVPNVAPSLNMTVPFALPFSIGIPGGPAEQEMASVITRPIRLNGSSRIELGIFGKVTVDLHTPLQSNSSSPLSAFFQRYLLGQDNPITVHGVSGLPSFAKGAEAPPTWLLSALPQLTVPLVFPGPDPPPKIIHSVSIDKMRISEAGGKMLASGTVIAEIDLPPGMEHVALDVNGVRPDVLVFDGPATADDDPDEEYPPRAFGHIHPDEWLAAESRLSDNPFYPHRLIVTAPLNSVPLDVLPGRDRVLSGFVSKIVFKGGAMAGIRGNASVDAHVHGISGNVRLDGLPVTGSTWVGRH